MRQRGQVLLIIVMLAAVAATVILSLSFASRTETQLTKLEEESQKALAAAEGGIEAALRQPTGSYVLTELSGIQGFEGQVTVATAQGDEFVSPPLTEGSQYTFYLATYDTSTNTFSNPYVGNVTLYYSHASACDDIALEISIISGTTTPYTLTRYVADTGGTFGGSQIGQAGTGTLGGVSFNCRTQAIPLPSGLNPRVMIIRTLFEGTKLGFVGTATLPPQGRNITSEAKSVTGVTKKVQLFQSFPQLPTDFFVTSF